MSKIHDDVQINIVAEGVATAVRKLDAIEEKIGKVGKRSKVAGKEMRGLGTAWKTAAAAFAAAGVGAAVKGVLDFDNALGQLQVDLDMSNSSAMALRDRILKMSDSFGISKENVLSAYETFQSFAGTIDKYKGTMNALMMTHKATGASLEDLAKLQATLTESLLMTPDAAMQGIASLRAFANSGTMTLRKMAGELPEILGSVASLGFTGQRGITQVGTALGVAGQAFGGKAEQARTSVNMLFIELQKKADKFKRDLGISVFNKDGSMKDLTLIMAELAKKTGYGTSRGKKGLVNFFGESSIKTVGTWMTMLKSGKVGEIQRIGEQGRFADVEKAYQTKMNGVAMEAEKLSGILIALNSAFADATKVITGFLSQSPGTAAMLAGGALAAPLAARGVTAAGAAVRGAAAAGGTSAALGMAGMWAGGALAAGAVGAAVGHFLVDKGLGKALFGKSMSDTFADRAVDRGKLAEESKRYDSELQRVRAIEQARTMVGLQSQGTKNFGGADAILQQVLASNKIGADSPIVAELRNIVSELKNSKPKVVVRPAGGTDRVDARASRSQQ